MVAFPYFKSKCNDTSLELKKVDLSLAIEENKRLDSLQKDKDLAIKITEQKNIELDREIKISCLNSSNETIFKYLVTIDPISFTELSKLCSDTKYYTEYDSRESKCKMSSLSEDSPKDSEKRKVSWMVNSILYIREKYSFTLLKKEELELYMIYWLRQKDSEEKVNRVKSGLALTQQMCAEDKKRHDENIKAYLSKKSS